VEVPHGRKQKIAWRGSPNRTLTLGRGTWREQAFFIMTNSEEKKIKKNKATFGRSIPNLYSVEKGKQKNEGVQNEREIEKGRRWFA